jgi:arylsulfatase A-like enzyme
MRIALTVLILFTTLLNYGQTKKSYAIQWDEKLMQGRKEYLSVPYSTTENTPNVILIVADDLGQTDISLYGSRLISTPNIDAIGNNGVTFEEGYVTSPVCSPSRAGLLTGRYQQRFGHELQTVYQYPKNFIQYAAFKLLPTFRPVTPLRSKTHPTEAERKMQGFPPSEITLAEVLKKNNYTTAIIGKWHLGSQEFARPCNRGFDYQFGFNEAFTLYMDSESALIVNAKVRRQFMDKFQWKTAANRTGDCSITRNCFETVEVNEYLTNRLTTEAINFISANKTNSFFLYLPYSAPHAPIQSLKEDYESFNEIEKHIPRTYLAVIKNLDDQIGRLTRSLDSLGLTDNTIIFFISDNGGATYNGSTDNFPFRGGKLTNLEGGIRIPFMMQWKGSIKPNQVYQHPVSVLDIFMTTAANTNSQLPGDRDFDGVNLVEHLDRGTPAHSALFWRSDRCKAIRKGDWKLNMNEITSSTTLYNIGDDPGEMIDLYQSHPEKVFELNADFKKWESQMIAPLWPRMVNYIHKDKFGKQKFAF